MTSADINPCLILPHRDHILHLVTPVGWFWCCVTNKPVTANSHTPAFSVLGLLSLLYISVFVFPYCLRTSFNFRWTPGFCS